jgi:hypothetical protein
MSLPLWAIGLILAGAAPFMVRIITSALDARARKRTEEKISAVRREE